MSTPYRGVLLLSYCLLSTSACRGNCGEQAQQATAGPPLTSKAEPRPTAGALPEAAPQAEPVRAMPEAAAPLTKQEERMYEGIFHLAAEDSRGDLEAYVTCRSDCDVKRMEQDLAGLRQFLALEPEVALEKTLAFVHWCVGEGLFMPEWLHMPCEGGLFALGFLEGLPEDKVMLQSFKRYLNQELSPEQHKGLHNVFYPRFNGIVWLHERQRAAEWVALIEALDRKHALYESDQLQTVRDELLSPPTHENRDEFLFPPFSIHRRLRALVR